jgi:hypothetical protein
MAERKPVAKKLRFEVFKKDSFTCQYCGGKADMPMIEPILVEVPNPAHPFGAKGVGEVNIVPPMAAIANAIDSAIHRRLTELPMSPPKVRAALDHAGADD